MPPTPTASSPSAPSLLPAAMRQVARRAPAQTTALPGDHQVSSAPPISASTPLGTADSYSRVGQSKAAALTSAQQQSLRPSQLMMLWANHQDKTINPAMRRVADAKDKAALVSTMSTAIQSQHKKALLEWMNKHLKGTQLKMGVGTAAVTGGVSTVAPSLLLSAQLALVSKDLAEKGIQLGSGPIPEATKEVAKQIATVVQGEIGSVNLALDLFANLPMLGLLFSVLQAQGLTMFVIMTAWEKSKSQAQLASSCSVIEQVGLQAVIDRDNVDLIDKGTDLAKTGLGIASSVAGLGSLATLPISFVKLIVKLVLLVKEYIAVEEANLKLQQGQIDEALLKKHPVLGLTLPHLRGVDIFSVLGIMPLGWVGNPSNPSARELQRQALKAENRWMFDLLTQGEMLSKVPDLWKNDFDRVTRLLNQTSYHLYEERYMLVDGSSQLLYQPPPITKWQEVKQYIKQKIFGSSPIVTSPSEKFDQITANVNQKLDQVAAKVNPKLDELEAKLDQGKAEIGALAMLIRAEVSLKFRMVVRYLQGEKPIRVHYETSETDHVDSGNSFTGSFDSLESQPPTAGGVTDVDRLPDEQEHGSGSGGTSGMPPIAPSPQTSVSAGSITVHRFFDLTLEDVEDS